MQSRSRVKVSVALLLAALVFAACSGSDDSKPAASAAGQRTIADIWADMLTQRDQIHFAFAKDMELVSHQDCRDVGTSAARMTELYSELLNVVGSTAKPEDRGRLRSLGDAIGRASTLMTRIRESALMEAPGMWPDMTWGLDDSLREIETYFNAEALNSESVVRRPGYQLAPPPKPPSPI